MHAIKNPEGGSSGFFMMRNKLVIHNVQKNLLQ